jgi:hypothetical protein
MRNDVQDLSVVLGFEFKITSLISVLGFIVGLGVGNKDQTQNQQGCEKNGGAHLVEKEEKELIEGLALNPFIALVVALSRLEQPIIVLRKTRPKDCAGQKSGKPKTGS